MSHFGPAGTIFFWTGTNVTIQLGLKHVFLFPSQICHFFRWQQMWHVTFVTFLGRMWRSRTRIFFLTCDVFCHTKLPEKRHILAPPVQTFCEREGMWRFGWDWNMFFSSRLRFFTYIGSVKREGHLGSDQPLFWQNVLSLRVVHPLSWILLNSGDPRAWVIFLDSTWMKSCAVTSFVLQE